VLRSEYSESFLLSARVHESSPAERGISEWFRLNCSNYLQSAFFQNTAPGAMVGMLRNEDLEKQTFQDRSFDIVIHLDVMEHLFNPFLALREIYRTLVHGGKCIFTAPTYPGQLSSLQVAFRNEDGTINIVGEPEYHGNPQSAKGSLVTWRFGYDLPLLISRESNFDIEVRRFQSRRAAATGIMTEVYILTK
jgi:SAM-dependent methyltransferase